jgi:hypothetical protein
MRFDENRFTNISELLAVVPVLCLLSDIISTQSSGETPLAPPRCFFE